VSERESSSSWSEDQTCYIEWDDDEKFQHLTEREVSWRKKKKFSRSSHTFWHLLIFGLLLKISVAESFFE
jgi:hypothetical protein